MLATAQRGTATAAGASAASYGRHDPAQLTPISVPINYDEDADAFKSFVQNFFTSDQKPGYEAIHRHVSETDDHLAAKMMMAAEEEAEREPALLEAPKYLAKLQAVANLQLTQITIELDDMLAFDESNDGLVERIMGNTSRYLNLFSAVLDSLMPASNVAVDMAGMDVIDVIVSHRKARQQAANAAESASDLTDRMLGTGSAAQNQPTAANQIPPSLLRRYQLCFKPPTQSKNIKTPQQAVREIRAAQVGGMVCVKGIITRVSEVRPLLTVGTYTCERCGWEVYQEITSQAYLPLPECPTEECRRNQSKGQLVLQTRGSRFLKFQEARIQELTEQVPMGHIPRSMAVVLTGDLARCVNPGDQVVLSGIYMPKPYTGLKAIRAGLLTDTYLLAQDVRHLKPKYDVTADQLLHSEQAKLLVVEELSRTVDIYDRLARSIAPEIYGHLDVKKALLLLMVGGMTREMEDGMKIRGDINVCLMGDPGVAKSQLLKYISKIAPRAVYTTGKGSSGVGLTASVSKDPITGEMVLEGGALVLADNGICCIDEFDKMDESDRTAIHEVMEQQTISISKAGITTTLNARTSILAAANPLYGRYNPKKSPRENINLPPALLSRFDLLFLLLDSADVEEDTRLAEHVCQVHRTNEAPIAEADRSLIIVPDLFRLYVGTAKRYQPVIPGSLIEYVVGAYVGLRMNDLSQKDTTYTTPRTLLAVLRLSQALARVRFSNMVNQGDVDEAMRLMEVSRSSVDIHLDRVKPRESDPTTRILGLVRDLSRSISPEDGVRGVPMDVIRDTVRTHGFTDEQLQQCLVALDQCNIWTISPDGTILKIFD